MNSITMYAQIELAMLFALQSIHVSWHMNFSDRLLREQGFERTFLSGPIAANLSFGVASSVPLMASIGRSKTVQLASGRQCVLSTPCSHLGLSAFGNRNVRRV
jgi:hypothetical protein